MKERLKAKGRTNESKGIVANRHRPALPEISDQMRAWSTALADEVAEWPGATARSFFGFTALYRGEKIFGAVPRTKGFGNGNLLGFRIDNPPARLRSKAEDPRIGFIDKNNARWFTFELSCDSDIHGALDWLGEAYQAAGKRRKSNK